MTKNPRFFFQPLSVLLLSVLFPYSKAEAQTFETALVPKPIGNYLSIGYGPSETKDLDIKPGLDQSSESNALSLTWQSGIIGFMAAFYQATGDSGDIQFISSRIEAEVARYRPIRQWREIGVPLVLSSRFTSWKRENDKPETRLSGTSILIGSGITVEWVGDEFQIVGSATGNYGLGIQELTDYSGTVSTADFELAVIIPYLMGDFGVVTGVQGTFEEWNFRRQPGDFTSRSLSVQMGICW